MVRGILRRIAAPVRGLHQAAYLLALLTLASQILALIRDRTFAHTFGAGQLLDLYYAAFKVPDLVFALVASLVSAYVLIPRIADSSTEESKRLLSHATSFLLIGGGVLCAGLAVFAAPLLFALFPEFAHSPFAEQFVTLARILLLQPILLGLSGILTSVTQVHRRFVLFALSPVLYNLGIIFGAEFLYPIYGLPGIGYGVVLGALAHVAIHLPVVAQARLMPRLVLPSWSLMAEVVRESVPRSLALGIGSAALLALTAVAAKTGAGSISVFTFASNLEAVPLALIGSSYAIAAFPVLAELSGKADKTEFTRVLSAAARHLVLWSIVVIALAIVLRAHLVRTILGTGAFDWNATRLTAAVLAILLIGLAAQGLILLLSRALYAARQSWRPLVFQLIGGGASVLIAVAGLLFVRAQPSAIAGLATLLRTDGVPGIEVLIVAIGAALGQLVVAALLIAAMRTSAPGFAKTLLRPAVEGSVAALLGASASYGVLALMGNIAQLTTLAAVFTQGLAAGIVGLAVTFAVLWALGNEEFADIRAALMKWVTKRPSLPTFGS